MNIVTERCRIGEVEIVFETGKLAKQANSIVVTCGDTSLLVTAVSSRDPKDLPFLPLTVEYREYNAAAGKIPGGYFKREGRPTDQETLTCRFIDRPVAARCSPRTTATTRRSSAPFKGCHRLCTRKWKCGD